MINFLRKRLFWAILFVVFNLFMLIGVQNNITIFSNVILNTSNFIHLTMGKTTSFFSRVLTGIKTYQSMRKENENLLQVIEKYQSHYKSIDAILFENQKLRELLQFRYSIDYDLVPAHIITSSIKDGSYEFIVDVGMQSGVQRDMIVCAISEQRLVLVGMVSHVQENYSSFTSLQQNNFFIPIVTNQSNQKGILSGMGALSNTLNVTFDDVYESKNVFVGEEVLVQKYSSLFPQGIPIGTITNITTSSENLLLVAEVEPLVLSDMLNLILVLTPYKEEE